MHVNAQDIAILKYKGGGDWYSNPTAMSNLIAFCNSNINTFMNEKPEVVEAGSSDIFQYPFIHMTGHGNVFFDEDDIQNLRSYLLSGGFLHIDDNYGMRPYLEAALKKLFPNKQLTELSAKHPIFKTVYNFPDGLPKIHEHDGKAPLGLGIVKEGRLMLFYTTESDLGDGWEDQTIHNDSEATRLKALQMGANILSFVFLGE